MFIYLFVLGREAVDSWYSEIKDYKWSSPGFTSETGNTNAFQWVPQERYIKRWIWSLQMNKLDFMYGSHKDILSY